ncbi:MAG TPA: antibiotic biosynthesis monooxygenase [Actinomycetota bacterium]|jgi:quinol monooxygenase YgiN|nr:antibiotic biosynthesis monooxygenase [Actinomycetota bacterium]
MYGTVARIRVKTENRDALRKVFDAQSSRQVEGFKSSYVLWENEGDAGWLVAIFEDRATYDKNADDPAMHEQYVAYRALMEAEPEWHDGEIESA